jgi:hypothetical protein
MFAYVKRLKPRTRNMMRNPLMVSSRRDATDERDKVFAILGLVDGGQPFQADYKKSLVEIHFDVLMELIKDGSGLNFLTWTQDDEL